MKKDNKAVHSRRRTQTQDIWSLYETFDLTMALIFTERYASLSEASIEDEAVQFAASRWQEQ